MDSFVHDFILVVYLTTTAKIGDNIFFKFILDIIMMNLKITKIVKKKGGKNPLVYTRSPSTSKVTHLCP